MIPLDISQRLAHFGWILDFVPFSEVLWVPTREALGNLYLNNMGTLYLCLYEHWIVYLGVCLVVRSWDSRFFGIFSVLWMFGELFCDEGCGQLGYLYWRSMNLY